MFKCPRDGAELQVEGYWKHPRSACPRCQGYFLGQPDAVEIVGARNVRALPPGTISCPRDGSPMHVLAYHEVELDLCPSCGSLWTDSGELKAITDPALEVVVVSPPTLVDESAPVHVLPQDDPNEGTVIGILVVFGIFLCLFYAAVMSNQENLLIGLMGMAVVAVVLFFVAMVIPKK